MKVLLLKTTKYKGKMLRSGIHEVTKTKANEWKRMGIADIQEEPRSDARQKNNKETTADPSEIEKLHLEADAFGVDVTNKSPEEIRTILDQGE